MTRKDLAEIIKKYLAENGRKGGAKGGKSTSKAKQDAVKRNLEAARAKRWPKKSG